MTPLTPSPDSPTPSDAITLHIKCDPNLTNDDSDELVVHVLPEGRIMLEIYQGPGLGTNYVMTVLESVAAMQLKEMLRPFARLGGAIAAGESAQRELCESRATVAKLERENAALVKEREALKAEAFMRGTSEMALNTQLDQLRATLAERDREIAELKEQAFRADEEIRAATANIRNLTKEREELRARNKSLEDYTPKTNLGLIATLAERDREIEEWKTFWASKSDAIRREVKYLPPASMVRQFVLTILENNAE